MHQANERNKFDRQIVITFKQKKIGVTCFNTSEQMKKDLNLLLSSWNKTLQNHLKSHPHNNNQKCKINTTEAVHAKSRSPNNRWIYILPGSCTVLELMVPVPFFPIKYIYMCVSVKEKRKKHNTNDELWGIGRNTLTQ